MYWYAKKLQRIAVGIAVASLYIAYSCTGDLSSHNVDRPRYSDLPAFFQAEVERLNKQNPLVYKTVAVGEERERQEVRITSWETELSSFLAVDLNKAVYREEIIKDSVGDVITYRIDNPDLDIASVTVTYEAGRIVMIDIVRHIQNFLYDMEERLRYDKRKGYIIEKNQDIWVLGENKYIIEGEFRK